VGRFVPGATGISTSPLACSSSHARSRIVWPSASMCGICAGVVGPACPHWHLISWSHLTARGRSAQLQLLSMAAQNHLYLVLSSKTGKLTEHSVVIAGGLQAPFALVRKEDAHELRRRLRRYAFDEMSSELACAGSGGHAPTPANYAMVDAKFAVVKLPIANGAALPSVFGLYSEGAGGGDMFESPMFETLPDMPLNYVRISAAPPPPTPHAQRPSQPLRINFNPHLCRWQRTRASPAFSRPPLRPRRRRWQRARWP
jgi:hypothetical protein